MNNRFVKFETPYSLTPTYRKPRYLCEAIVTRSKLKDSGDLDYDTRAFECNQYNNYREALVASLTRDDEPRITTRENQQADFHASSLKRLAIIPVDQYSK